MQPCLCMPFVFKRYAASTTFNTPVPQEALCPVNNTHLVDPLPLCTWLGPCLQTRKGAKGRKNKCIMASARWTGRSSQPKHQLPTSALRIRSALLTSVVVTVLLLECLANFCASCTVEGFRSNTYPGRRVDTAAVYLYQFAKPKFHIRT